ncbi:asparagine synthase-related protein [Ureibacillus acetophenoni]|uniref:Asparagine synthetase domain-containing protein n=1 Tax=Ureibacillus acetophenoni TaxID=614649 RepID=A0A285UB02_9BACL|nr:asparagine synthase-related protein [Ureibacillus acetophenoni]SOC38598.1 hypothetical protein SAMN05877842_104188 [Ureibacillus acetophenoni]
MLISYEEGIININNFECIEINGYKYYYSGIIWMRGKKAGKETVEHLSKIYEVQNKIPFIEIFGSFCLVILHPNGRIVLFTDNSNMRTFYIGKKLIGTNYLEVIKEKTKVDFNLDALCEFFTLGDTYFGKTLLNDIRLTESTKYYICDDGGLLIKDKGIGDIDEDTSIKDVNEFFKEMAYSLSDLKVTMSLTGGYDSRLIFACINDYLTVKPFISGDNEKHKDIIYSQKVAEAVGRKIEILRIKKPEISDDFILSLFYFSQGIVPFLKDGFVRMNSFIIDRSNKGYECYITGDGGDVHKDWDWTLDLPFYNRKSTNIPRYYDHRIQNTSNVIPFGDSLESLHKQLREKMINEFSKFSKAINTQSYDSFGFNIYGDENKIDYGTLSDIIPSYAPLWELELVRYSYHLPRRKRFFNFSMREITTKASKKIARVPTFYGTTASSETPYLIRDTFMQIVEYFKRACRMLGRKFLNKNLFVENKETWSIENDLRKLSITTEAIEYCIEKGFIKKGTLQEDLSFELLGRIIHVYLLAIYIEDNLLFKGPKRKYKLSRMNKLNENSKPYEISYKK